MARRRFSVRDIDEILAYWYQTGSIQSTATSLGVHRGAVRKYIQLDRERGYLPGAPSQQLMPWYTRRSRSSSSGTANSRARASTGSSSSCTQPWTRAPLSRASGTSR